MPESATLLPSLKAAAALLVEEAQQLTVQDGSQAHREAVEGLIAGRFWKVLEIESASCEAMCSARGDHLAKIGDVRGSEVAYGLAGAIRLRREQWLEELRGF